MTKRTIRKCCLSLIVVVTGIEPIFSEPKSDVLPLDDTTIISLIAKGENKQILSFMTRSNTTLISKFFNIFSIMFYYIFRFMNKII